MKEIYTCAKSAAKGWGKLFFLLLLLVGGKSWGQATIVNYTFDGSGLTGSANVTSLSGVNPVMTASVAESYFAGNPGTGMAASFATSGATKYFELTLSTTNLTNLKISFDGRSSQSGSIWNLSGDPTGGTSFSAITSLTCGNGSFTSLSSTSLSASNLYDNKSSIKLRFVCGGTTATMRIDNIVITATLPTPTTTSLSPASGTAGGSAFTLTVNGTNFINGLSTVSWNGSNRTTTYGSSTQLTASISGADIATAGTANVGVTTTGAAATSNTQIFTINSSSSPNLSITGTPTNHGAVCQNISASPVSYTITNTGSVAANGVTVTSNDPQFVVSGLSSTTIGATNGTATYSVTFTPTASGSQSATITVSSSTSGSNSPTSSLSGTGIGTVTQAVSSAAAGSVVTTSATLNGNLTTLGVCPATSEKGFVYSLTSVNATPTVGGTGVTKQAVSGLTTGPYSFALSGLTSGAGYSYNAYVYNGTTYTYGATTQTFTTLGTPPTLTAAAGATVDNPFAVTFTEDATWRNGITGITVGGTPLPSGAYDITFPGQITFTPSASSLLQTAGNLAIVVSSNNYATASVTQSISAGAANKLAVSTALAAPATNGGVFATQPAITVKDQYSNTVTGSTASITAAVGSGSWTLAGGTNPLSATSGVATFSGLTATSAAAVTGATISFTSPGLTGISSASFNIPAPAPSNDLCTAATPLVIDAATVLGSLVSSTYTSPFTSKNDVWYKFTPTCSNSHTVTVTGFSGDVDIQLFSGVSCPSSTTFLAQSNSSTPTETISYSVAAGTIYYVRVLAFDATAQSSDFTIKVAATAPVTPVVTTNAASAVLNTTATLNGNVGALGTCPSTSEKGFVYSLTATNNNPQAAGTGVTKQSVSGLSTGAYTLPLSSLTPGAQYSFAAYLFDGTTYTYGSVLTFITSNGPPTLTAAAGATVDNPFDVTFTDDATWRGQITSVKIGGTTLTAGYTVSASKITFTPSASNPATLLQSAGTKAITVQATGYTDASVSQPIGVGVANKLAIQTQPAAPASNGATLATQPAIIVQDQYGNTVTTSSAAITAAATSGLWTIGGTTSVSASSGVTSFTNLTAYKAGGYSGATITFSSPGLTSVASGSFNIPTTSVTDYFQSNVNGGQWNTASSWQSSPDNSTWVTASIAPNASASGITIRNGFNITSSVNISVDDVTVEAGATLTVSGGTFTISDGGAATDMTVNGTLTINAGTISKAAAAGLSFTAGSIYTHAVNGGTIPSATWNATSTCNVTGMTNTTPVNYAQAYGNFTWNCAQTGSNYINIDNNAFSVAETLTIGPASTNLFSFGNLSGIKTNSVKNLIVSGGIVNVVGTAGTVNLNVTNDLTLSGGTVNIQYATVSGTLSVTRDMIITGGSLVVLNDGGGPSSAVGVGRDLLISGSGTINLKATTGTGIATITVARDFTSTGTAVASGGANGIVDFGIGNISSNAIYVGRNFNKSGAGTFGSSTTNATPALGFVFTGGTSTIPATLSYSGANSEYTSYSINSGAYVQLQTNLTLGGFTPPVSRFTLNGTGSLDFQAKSIIGNSNAEFVTTSGANFITSNSGGIGGTTATGSLQSFGSTAVSGIAVGRATLVDGVNYTFNGATTSPFPLTAFGNPGSLTTNAAVISNMVSNLSVSGAVNINSSSSFTLNPTNNNSLALGGTMTIASTGTFNNGGSNQVTASGSPSIIVNGTFITQHSGGMYGTNTAVPSINMTFNSGSTAEYGGASQAFQTFSTGGSSQILAVPTNITFSGTGTKTGGSINTLNPGLITIKANVIVDATAGANFGGSGTALTMETNSKLSVAGSSVQPTMTGAYSLATGSTIEFAGSSATDIRVSPSYYHVIVSGSNVSTSTNTASIGLQSGGSFTVSAGGKFKTRNANGFSGGASTSVSSTNNPSIVLATTSTIDYSEPIAQVITNQVAYGNFEISAISGVKTAPSGTLSIKGNFTKSGASTFNNNSGTVSFDGTSATTQTFTSSGTGIEFYSLQINNSGSGGITIVNDLGVQNALNFPSGSTAKLILAAGNMSIRSAATNTASVGMVPSASTISYSGTGRFIVEKYILTPRKWQFLSPDATTDGTTLTVQNSWMNSRPVGEIAASNGLGMWVTGVGGTGAGFDATTSTPTIKWWNGTVFSGITDPVNYDIHSQTAYMAYVRGDRSCIGTNTTAIPTTLKTKGKLHVGDYPSGGTLVGAGGVNVAIGNPYASAIYLKELDNGGGLTVPMNLFVWDPKLAGSFGLGGFQTLSGTIADGFTISPGGGSYSNIEMGAHMDTIESGQAFFVQPDDNTNFLIKFTESAKTNYQHTVSFTAGQEEFLGGRLYIQQAAGNVLVDGFLVKFKNSYSNEANFSDAFKMTNTAENISVKTGSKLLAVELRKPATDFDTIHVNMANLRTADYNWDLVLTNMDQPGRTAFLVDRYTNTEQALDLAGHTAYHFTTNMGTAATVAPDRFIIVFRPTAIAGPLPVKFTSISAARQKEKVEVRFNTENEINMDHYTVERSANGLSFSPVMNNGQPLNVSPTNNAGGHAVYTQTDTNPLTADNYYRIRGISNNGQVQFSAIAKVGPLTQTAAISISPNPVVGEIMNIRFADQPAGKYTVKITDMTGRVLMTKTIEVRAGNSIQTINLPGDIAAGSYGATFINETGKSITVSFIIK